MLPPIRLPQVQQQEVEKLLEEDSGRLERLAESLRNVSQPPFTASELRLAFAGVLDSEKATTLARLLVSLGSYCRRYSADSSSAVDALTRGLAVYASWGPTQLEKWEQRIKPILDCLMEIEHVHVLAKAIDLAFDYANLLESVRIITDIRPIFDDKHNAIVAAIVSQIFRLEYAAGNERKNVSLLLDRSDIEHLRTICDEALRKMDKVHEFMAAPRSLRTINTGDDIYDLS